MCFLHLRFFSLPDFGATMVDSTMYTVSFLAQGQAYLCLFASGCSEVVEGHSAQA
jgi:hypothetical protein